MSSINRVVITGNLTRDPELRSTSGGMSILQLGIAVNDRRKVDGEWTDVPNFFNVTVFGSRGESLSRFLSKGSKVAVEGKLRSRSWEAPDGSKRTAVEIVADDIEFLSPRGDEMKAAAASLGATVVSETFDEDIPF